MERTTLAYLLLTLLILAIGAVIVRARRNSGDRHYRRSPARSSRSRSGKRAP